MRLKSQCANGLPGYDRESGKSYTPRPACSREHSPGHIFCTQCRVEAGGYDRQQILKTKFRQT
jgi:hypothetical protein